MDDHARYGSLRDYLRVISTQRVLILAVMLITAGTALGFSLQQPRQYSASATMAFQDVSQDVNLLGNAVPARDAPAVLAAQSAATVERSDIVAGVRERLSTTLTDDQLRDRVSAEVQTRSNLVDITTRADDADAAADISNAFARETEQVFNQDARDRFRVAARRLRERFNRERDSLDPNEKLLYQSQRTRLESLGAFARAASVNELARADDTPIAPQPVRNTIFGLLVGLTLGLLFAFVRDALDRRLATAEDVRDLLPMPIIGYVREEALRQRLYDRKADRRDVGEIDLEAFRIMRRNLDFLDVDRSMDLVAVTSAVPEEGKSTVAASLAVAAASSGLSVMLLECDLRRPTLSLRLGAEGAPGLSDYLLGEREPGQIVQTVRFSDSRQPDGSDQGPQIAFIAAGNPAPDPAVLLGSDRFAQLLEEVRAVYDLVVVDTSPLLPVVDTLEFLPRVNGVILCVRVGQTTREEARGAQASLERIGEHSVGVVVTGTKAGDSSSYGGYGGTYAYPQRATVNG